MQGIIIYMYLKTIKIISCGVFGWLTFKQLLVYTLISDSYRNTNKLILVVYSKIRSSVPFLKVLTKAVSVEAEAVLKLEGLTDDTEREEELAAEELALKPTELAKVASDDET